MTSPHRRIELTDLYSSISPKVKLQKSKYLASGIYPVVSQESELVNGYSNDANAVIEVDVPLIGFGDHTKTVKFIDFDFVYGADGLKLLKAKENLEPRYLFYFLNNLSLPDLGYARHSKLLSGLSIPFPTLDEQKRIVAKLDEALGDLDQVTENSKSELDQIDALWNAILNTEMSLIASQLGGKEVSLAEIATLVNGRAYKKDELLSEGKYRVLRVGNFFSNSSWYWSNLELDEDKYCDNGDLLYAWSASFGPRVWTEEKVIYHYHIWKVLVDSKAVDRDWLRIWFEWDVDQIKNSAGVGTTIMHVTKGSMESRLIQLPPLSEQKRIVAKLDELKAQIDSLRRVRQGKVEEAKSLRSSILSSAFAGEF